MAKVSFGVGLFAVEPPQETLRLARAAEAVGFDTVLVGDSNMIWREVYVLLGAIATQTSRVTLMTGVTHPHLRHPAITASALVTLAELTGGRVRLGIGIGATGPANLGLPPVGAGELKRAIMKIRALMRGEKVPLDGGFEGHITYAQHDIPIYVAANSDVSLKMTAAVADGAIIGGTVWEPDEQRLERLREFESGAGRPAGSVRALHWGPCSISEDPSEAFQAVKGMVARVALVGLGIRERHGRPIPDEDRQAYERLKAHYDTMKHMEQDHAPLVLDRWVSMASLSGTAEQVRHQVQEVIAHGWDEIAIVPFGKDREQIIRTFGEQVIHKL